MKYLKYLAFAFMAVALASCAENDGTWDGSTDWDGEWGWNTADNVSVQFDVTAIEVTENQGICYVPFSVTGNPNGYIQVKVALYETGENPAMVNAHYYLSSYTINVRPERDANNEIHGRFEFRPQDNRGEDPTRTFIMKIESVKGNASIAMPNEALVSIVDKGSSPVYRDLAGRYFMSYLGYDFDLGTLSIEHFALVNVTCSDPDNMDITISGVESDYYGNNFTMKLHYNYDMEEKYGELEFINKTPAGNFSGYPLAWETYDGSEKVVGKWNTTYTGVTFGDPGDSDTIAFLLYAFENGEEYAPLIVMSGFTLTKVVE